PEGTLSWRLAHAKKLLAKRLSCYGSLAATLSQSVSSACVPPALLNATARAAMQAAAGQVLSTGVVSTPVITLTEGVIKAMLFSKLKAVWVVVLALSLSAGAIGLSYRAVAAPPGQASGRPQAADELEELRLGVAALRKGLQTTRERDKTLEGEVQSLKAS